MGDLVRAVHRESNQTVARWWGVTGQTVTKWRRALDVERTAGDHERSREVGHIAYPHAKSAMLAKSQDPIRCEKIAAAKRGKSRPKKHTEPARLANIGRKHSQESRRKMSVAQRRLGTRPPKAGRPWTADEDAVCRTLPAAEVAERTGRTLTAVHSRRSVLGLEDARGEAAKARQTWLYAHVWNLLPELAELRAAGHSCQKLADWLNAAGTRNRRGQEWNDGQVRTMLKWFVRQGELPHSGSA